MFFKEVGGIEIKGASETFSILRKSLKNVFLSIFFAIMVEKFAWIKADDCKKDNMCQN